MKRICICAALVWALTGVGEAAAVSVTHSRARLGAIAERKAPNGDRMLYGLGYCLQVGPTSVGRTADGSVFVAGNFQKGYRRHLALWPILPDGQTLGEPVTVRNAETEFGPNTGQWLIDHPVSAILRLRGGEIVSVLSYRARDDFWGKDRNHPVTAPSPEAGCYIETVTSPGKPVPVWEFL